MSFYCGFFAFNRQNAPNGANVHARVKRLESASSRKHKDQIRGGNRNFKKDQKNKFREKLSESKLKEINLFTATAP